VSAGDAPRGILLERGSLWRAVRRRTEAALASGALEPLESEVARVRQRGIPFVVRRVPALARRPSPGPAYRSASRTSPFLPPEPELVVADVSATHVCVLNKYPVIDHHVLVVTRELEDQQAPLTLRDFEALWACLLEYDGLGFYNAGEAAGASQRHKHLQVVPTPLASPRHATPLDAVLAEARFGGAVGTVPGLGYLHALARLRAVVNRAPADAAATLLALYREMARAFGCDRPGRPYNLLVCRDWMLFVPRARAAWRGVAVNALGYAGALVVPGREELETVRREGPLRVLAKVAVPTDG